METYGNDIEIQQGENFNMDVILTASNLEYIPFIVSSERKNPYFVITIASTKYEKNMRYVDSWWNDLLTTEALPTFYQTTPVYLGELETTPSTVDDIKRILPNINESSTIRYLYQYTLTSDSFDEEVGHKPYHYVYFDYTSGITTARYDYECRVIQNFKSDITRLWGAQNYMYQITLVSGKTNKEVILDIYKEYGTTHPDFPIPKKEDGTLYTAYEQWGDQENEYIAAAYKYIKRQWPSLLQPDIDEDSPLYYIDNPETIVPPSKLTVNNNLRQMI